MNTRTCTVCKVEYPHIDSGRTHSDGTKVYVSDDGRSWKYHRCPSCLYGEASKRVRKSAVNHTRPKTRIKLTKRLCTFCKKRLPKGRRFFHKECYNISDLDDTSLMFGSGISL